MLYYTVPYTGLVVAVQASSHLHTLFSAFLARREDDIWSLRDTCNGVSGATTENGKVSFGQITEEQGLRIKICHAGVSIFLVGIPNSEALPRLSSTKANNYL